MADHHRTSALRDCYNRSHVCVEQHVPVLHETTEAVSAARSCTRACTRQHQPAVHMCKQPYAILSNAFARKCIASVRSMKWLNSIQMSLKCDPECNNATKSCPSWLENAHTPRYSRSKSRQAPLTQRICGMHIWQQHGSQTRAAW